VTPEAKAPMSQPLTEAVSADLAVRKLLPARFGWSGHHR
jgi:hypothetical protein